MMIDKELEMKEWVLSVLLKTTNQDYYKFQQELLVEREKIRQQMYDSIENKQTSNSAKYNNISENTLIGKNVMIWHLTYVGDNVEIGDDSKIGSLTHVDYDVKIGKNTKIEGQVYIPPKTVIGNDCFLGPGVVLTNDLYPMSEKMIGVTVEDGAIIGAGSVIRPGVTIGKNSVVAMGSIVTKDVPEGVVVMGNPAMYVYSRDVYDKKREEYEQS